MRLFLHKMLLLLQQKLLGKYLIRIIDGKQIICKIIETEAYDGPTDDVNHGFNRRSLRNETLF